MQRLSPWGRQQEIKAPVLQQVLFFMSVPRYKNKTLWKSKQKRRPGKSRDASFCINSLYFLPLHQAASFHRK